MSDRTADPCDCPVKTEPKWHLTSCRVYRAWAAARDSVTADPQLSPEARAWKKFVSGAPTRETVTDSCREAFSAGMSAGIAFTMDQIGWTLENRAKGVPEDD